MLEALRKKLFVYLMQCAVAVFYISKPGFQKQMHPRRIDFFGIMAA